ncbi:related to integral membrane protein PTH11 [Fusarium oxysporum]|uniref:Related to integral membrane protein PTH11 n=1 Tax=Fusarium oxysporum TaxID=5507 RepID=A0A2H3TCL6_FUSOX|nr:related to integral membrane protein PTH11 [Fusarium oxysporum]
MSVYWGNGKHFDVLSLEQKQNTIKWMMAAYVPSIETLGFPKLAVIALLARLLMPGKIHLVVLWSMGIICCLSLTAMVTTLLLQCSPPRALWTLTMPRDCLAPSKLEGLAFWASSISAFLDFYLAVYPAITLWKLLMPLKKKLILSLALGMGVVCGAIGIVKATGVPTLASQDVSYDLCDPLYWTSVEGNLIIIAACIPVLQPILEMLKGRNIWSTNKGSGKHQYEDYSKQSGQQQPGIELKDKPRKKVDTYGFTIQGKEGSEENMVDVDKVSRTTSSRPESPKEGMVRTDQVTVGYDGGEGGPTSAAKRWAAV